MLLRKLLLATSGLVTLAIAGQPAFAQNAASDANDSSDPNTIVVTARLRKESLQDVPLSINAVGAEQIEREGLRRVDDLTRISASLTYDIGGFPNDTRPALRGMQAERGRPSVAVLLDGQDLSSENISIAGGSAALRMSLFDLERIEVVKGPQATLYGRNAFAGAINYISKRPSSTWGGRFETEVASGNFFSATASVTGAIVSDVLAFRLNANARSFDGYYRNPVNGARLGGERSEGFAAALLLTPGSGITVHGRIQFTKDRMSDNATAFIPSNTRLPVLGGTFTAGPPGSPATACPASLVGLAAAAVTACTRGTVVGEIRATEDNLQMSLNPLTGRPPFGMIMDSTLGSLSADWDTGNAGVFHYSFGYLRDHSLVEQDGDFTNHPAPPGLVLSLQVIQNLEYRNRHTDHTFYWTYETDRLNLIAGVQRFEESSSLRNTSQFWLRNPASPLGGPPFNLSRAPLAMPTFPVNITRDTDYWGVFAGVGFEIFEGLKVTGEVRYNKDDIAYTSSGYRRQDVSLSQLTPVCLPNLVPGAVFVAASPATSPPPGTVVACPQAAKISDDRWTPRATLEYKWTPDLLTYVSYAEGFKPGGFNTNEIVSFANQGYRAETVSTIEAGIKSSWLDRRLTINLSAYRNRYRDQQIGVQLTQAGAGGGVVTTAGIINAASVAIWGLEADIAWRIADPVTLSLGYAFTDAKFGKYVQGPLAGSPAALLTQCGVAAGQSGSAQNVAEAQNICADFSGRTVGKSPRHSLNLGALWSEQVGKARLFAETSAQYRSARFTDESNLATLPEYWLVNLRAGAEIDGVSITMYVDNLFDSARIQSAQRNVDFGTPEGFAPGRGFIAYLPKPRVFGLRVGSTF